MKKKIIIGIAGTAMACMMAIGGTMAFMTDSEKQTNIFTVGTLDITLSEPNWNPSTDGKEMEPGDTILKDPVVSAVENNCYFRTIVTYRDSATHAVITDANRIALIDKTIYFDGTYAAATGTPGTKLLETKSFRLSELAAYDMVNPAFTKDASRSSAGVTYYNYNTVLSEGSKAVLFTNIVIPTDWNQTQLDILGEYEVEIYAQAIQSKNIASAAEAFNAIDGEISGGTLLYRYGTTA